MGTKQERVCGNCFFCHPKGFCTSWWSFGKPAIQVCSDWMALTDELDEDYQSHSSASSDELVIAV